MVQPVFIVSCAFSEHWDESGFVFSLTTAQVAEDGAIRSLLSLLFFQLNELNSLRFFSHVVHLRTLIVLVNLRGAHSSLSLFFLYWGAQK